MLEFANMELKNLSNNWKKLQETLKKNHAPGSTSSSKRKITETDLHQNGVKRRKIEISKSDKLQKSFKSKRMPKIIETERKPHGGTTTTLSAQQAPAVSLRKAALPNERVNEGRSPTAEIGKYVAVDCEMVGVGPDPDKESALARVSIVNWNGDQVYDSFVRTKEEVTDWRTYVSGISPKDMINARSLEEVQKDIAEILEGTILVGHAVRNDLNALLLGHPKRDIRDTSKHPPYRKIAGGSSPRLKMLAAELLGLKIQEGAHSSVKDARATMLLFRRDKDGFEREHARKWPARTVMIEGGEDKVDKTKKKQKKKKKKKSRKR